MWKYHKLVMISIILAIGSTSYSNEYKNYKKLNPDECVPLDERVIVSQLPTEWHNFVGFIKICNLKHKKSTTSQASLISIWVVDYYDTKFPSPAPRKWENFPLPIVVDGEFHPIGQLTQQYPDDPPREIDIYYREHGGIPSEILIDVYNQAVSGDYYYAPLIWNVKSNRYEMKDMEAKYGKRRK